MKNELIKSNAAAEYLGVSRSSIINWVNKGLLKGTLTPGNHLRFTLEELNNFAENQGFTPQNTEIFNDTKQKNLKILVIEDDKNFRDFVKDALDVFKGYELREVEDGMKGALLIGSWLPDLIILDIRMPNMNGVEFLSYLKENIDKKNMKIIVTSAYLSQELKQQIKDLDINIILEKPVRLTKLVAAIVKLTNLQIED